MYETGTEVLPPLANSLIVLPNIRTPSLGNGIVRTVAEALVLGVSGSCRTISQQWKIARSISLHAPATSKAWSAVVICRETVSVLFPFHYISQCWPEGEDGSYRGVQSGKQRLVCVLPVSIDFTAALNFGARNGYTIGLALGRWLPDLLCALQLKIRRSKHGRRRLRFGRNARFVRVGRGNRYAM